MIAHSKIWPKPDRQASNTSRDSIIERAFIKLLAIAAQRSLNDRQVTLNFMSVVLGPHQPDSKT